MKDPCLTPDAIADLVRGIATVNDERHVSNCDTCTLRVTLVRRIAAAGLERVAEVVEEAGDLVESFLSAPRSTWWKVVREPEYRRADVARRLLALAMDARWKDRSLAVALIKAAASIIQMVGPIEDRELPFEIWKWAATILREAGHYAELPEAFTRAEVAARITKNPEVSEASICLSRALFYAEPDIWRPEEAAKLLDRAEEVFAESDETRMLAVWTARAFLLFRGGNLSGASDVFAMLVTATSGKGGLAYLDALTNWVAVRVDLRDVDEDLDQTLEYVLEENHRLGRTVQVGRAHWITARLHVIRGEYASAVDLLRLAMDQIGDSDTSLRIGLDLVEALLLADSYHEAYLLSRELASASIALDHREPTRRHGLTKQVFAYLRDAVQHQSLTADLVTECARYLDRITRQRAIEFIPPMLLIEM
jgi:tetratricopeptide (TPR) repeat protein